VKNLSGGQKILIVTSEDDKLSPREAETGVVMDGDAQISRYLMKLVPDDVDKKLVVYQYAGHGTNMFGAEEPDLESEIIEFFREITSN